MKKALSTLLLSVALSPTLWAQDEAKIVTAWGDQGNGTYVNPILNADYSDPDAIRVGDILWMMIGPAPCLLRPR